jgi:fructokinase
MRRDLKPAPVVLCFGEILWDSLPDGLFPGGAPFNVCYHLQHQGMEAHMVSAVGRDWLGEELLLRLGHWGIGTEGIAKLSCAPTGTVRAEIGADGEARYTIAQGVAWDKIAIEPATLVAAATARAIVFGSLAQRSAHNQAALARLLKAVPADAEIVFDVNLRPPFDDLDLVRALAGHATVLKLNASEAGRLAGRPDDEAHMEEAHARRLAESLDCGAVCVTAGSRGAGFLFEGEWHWESAHHVDVVRTVGAGDAFLAALVAGLLANKAPKALLSKACRLGEWVVSQRSATPVYAGA